MQAEEGQAGFVGKEIKQENTIEENIEGGNNKGEREGHA